MSKWGLGSLVSKGYVMFHVIIYGPLCLFDEMPTVAIIAQDRTGPTRHEKTYPALWNQVEAGGSLSKLTLKHCVWTWTG